MNKDDLLSNIKHLIDEEELTENDLYYLNRNYNMRLRYHKLLNEGFGSVKAIEQVADEFNLSYERAKKIIYMKKGKDDKAA